MSEWIMLFKIQQAWKAHKNNWNVFLFVAEIGWVVVQQEEEEGEKAKQTAENFPSTLLSKWLSSWPWCVGCWSLCTSSTTSSVSGENNISCANKEVKWSGVHVLCFPFPQFTSLLLYSAWHLPLHCSAVLMQCWKKLVVALWGMSFVLSALS